MSEPIVIPPVVPPVEPVIVPPVITPPVDPIITPPVDPIITPPQEPSSSPDFGVRLSDMLKTQLGDNYPKSFEKLPVETRIAAMEGMLENIKGKAPPKPDPKVKKDIQIPGAPGPIKVVKPKSILEMQQENGYNPRYGKNSKAELVKKLMRKK